jgi:hypothetical protein
MSKRAKFINIDADPSGEFDFDGPNVPFSPRMQLETLKMMAPHYGGSMAVARREFEKSYGYKPTV